MHSLISAEADINAVDKHGWTALMYATKYGETGAVKTLIEAHANVYARDENGWTALEIAAECEHRHRVLNIA